MQTSKRNAGRIVAATAALVLVGVACGGDPGGSDGQVASLSGATATTAGEGKQGEKKSFEDAMLEYAKCMRANGVDMPDPTFDDEGGGRRGFIARVGGPASGGSKPDEAAFAAAQKECEPIMKRAQQDMPRMSPEEEAERRDQALKFAKCMRENGIDMPDPTFDDQGGTRIEVGAAGGSGGKAISGMGPATKVDEKFEAALKKCEEDAPMKRRAARS